MPNQALKDMATKTTAFEGAVTFYMLPYLPLSYKVMLRKLHESGDLVIQQGEYWAVADLVSWMAAESATVDIEFADTLPEDAQRLKTYWENRNGSPVANWQLAQAALTEKALNAWAEAYEATRSSSASEEEQAFDDPKAESDTGTLA